MVKNTLLKKYNFSPREEKGILDFFHLHWIERENDIKILIDTMLDTKISEVEEAWFQGWNACVRDAELNKKTWKKTILDAYLRR